MARSMENFTSAAVIGAPLQNFALSWSLKVYTFESGLIS